jgi:hypothetical protein
MLAVMRQPFSPKWRVTKPLIGMVHLLPLPGSPRWRGSMQQVLDAALSDAEALANGAMDGIMVENYGDAPFHPDRVPPATLAAMTAVVVEIRRTTSVPVGVNVLRNDAAAAIAICAATSAAFIRVNVHTGALLTDQGWLTGSSHETVRLRAQLGSTAAIFADVFVKHAVPPAGLSIEDAARDTWERGYADALIVSGAATGAPASQSDVQHVKAAVADAFILIGSGLTTENAPALLQSADGAIVGSSLKIDGHAESRVSLDRVQRLVDVVRSIRT